MNDRYRVELSTITGKTVGGYVTSKASQTKYRVVHNLANPNSWTCECSDFFDAIRTGKDSKECRHISAYIEQINSKPPVHDQETHSDKTAISCSGCGSTDYKKSGIKKNKHRNVQMYQCRFCKKRFVCAEPGFEHVKYDPHVIAGSINMVMSGMSYRKTAEQICFMNNMPVAPNTIFYWVKKYAVLIRRYTDALRPIIGDVLSADEAVIKVKMTNRIEGKGNVDWLWSAIDHKTRLVIATMISADSRTTDDASKLLEMCKKIGTPNYLVTDSLSSYDSAAAEAMPHTVHIKTKSIRDGFTNMSIERYHNEIREKLKTCRGLGNDGSAAIFANLLYIHHNFIRPHMGLEGRTPAEEAGMITADDAKGKYRTLIRNAGTFRLSENRAIARKLGRYAGLVTIRAETGMVTVVPNSWLENDAWRGITALLGGLGFVWMFTHIMRGWIRFENGPPVITPVVVKNHKPV